MKILKIIPSICHYVHIEGEDWSDYRRNNPDDWEVLMGQSWEMIYDTKNLEAAFQKELTHKENKE